MMQPVLGDVSINQAVPGNMGEAEDKKEAQRQGCNGGQQKEKFVSAQQIKD